MKYISLEKVENIIQLADKAYPDTTASIIVHGTDLTLETIEDTCPKEKLLCDTIEALGKYEFAEFCALRSIGKGDEVDLFEQLVAENIDQRDPVLPLDLTGPPLAKYLRLGVSKLT